jgi:hypothetical protein
MLTFEWSSAASFTDSHPLDIDIAVEELLSQSIKELPAIHRLHSVFFSLFVVRRLIHPHALIMKSTSAPAIFVLAFFTIFSLVASAPTPSPRDVFSPPVLYPGNGTIWRIGERHNVTWDLAHAPAHITNNIGMIILVRNHTLLDLGTLLHSRAYVLFLIFFSL